MSAFTKTSCSLIGRIIPAEAVIRLNGTVLLFTLAVAVLRALVFGLVPALQVSRRDLIDPSGTAARARAAASVTAGCATRSWSWRWRSAWPPVGAGLLMRSFVALREVDLACSRSRPGGPAPLPQDRYKTAEQLAGFYRPLLARLKALPGVVEATETSTLPPYGGIRSEVEVAGKTDPEKWNALVQLCSEGYFAVVRIAFLEGRNLQ